MCSIRRSPVATGIFFGSVRHGFWRLSFRSSFNRGVIIVQISTCPYHVSELRVAGPLADFKALESTSIEVSRLFTAELQSEASITGFGLVVYGKPYLERPCFQAKTAALVSFRALDANIRQSV
jgi:hypothetical protein